ncbi:MAG: DUF2157 domain-containing protein [Rhodocyclaceae bacterium]
MKQAQHNAINHRATRALLETLAADGRLSRAGLQRGLQYIGCTPAAAEWQRFADRLLLALGTLLLLSGIVFFFAYNWQALHRFVRMGLVAAPLAVCALLAWRSGGGFVGQAWLGGATVLTGVLLAVSGQIYQTGADTELLFFAWALLILPWVLVARAPWLWLFWLLLGNVALLLYVTGRLEIWTVFILADSLFWAPLLLNACALVAWEAGWRPFEWLRAGYGPRIIALVAAVSATALGIGWWWLGRLGEWRWMPYTPLLYGAWLGGTLWFYQHRRRDIVPLAAASFSAICVVMAGVLKHLRFRDSFAFDFLLLGLLVAGLTAAAALWLRRVAASWEAQA